MEILNYVWEFYLYIPLFNFLVWLYLTYSFFNFGVAVILLTILLRIILLPFSIITERGNIISDNLNDDIVEIKKDFANDPVKQKEMIRSLLKKKKIRPWAKAVVLGVQALVLVLLYQVFLGGINTEVKLHLLYPSIPRPDFINTKFLWLNIAEPNLVISALVAGYLFAQILIHAYNRKGGRFSKKEQIFSIFFPAAIFLVLAILPSVKSIFVLTSLIFSSIISVIATLIKVTLTQAKKQPQS